MAGISRTAPRLLTLFQQLTARQVTNISQKQALRYLHISGARQVPGILKPGEDPLKLSNKEWEKRLTPEQYYVCREKGTELPFSGDLVNNHEQGIYACTCCGVPLFSSHSSKSQTGQQHAKQGQQGQNQMQQQLQQQQQQQQHKQGFGRGGAR